MERKNRFMWKCGMLLLLFASVLSGCQQKRGDSEHSGTVSGESVSTQNAEDIKQKKTMYADTDEGRDTGQG